MIPHVPYDQELIDFHQAAFKHPLVLVNSSQTNKLNQAVFNLMFENLLANKKTLIICKQPEKAKLLMAEFEKYDLAKFILHLKDLDIVQDRDRASFLKANIPNKSLSLEDIIKLSRYAKIEREKIDAIYHQLNEPCFGKKTIKDLIHAYQKVSSITEKAELNLDLNERFFSLTKDEFWNLRAGLNASITKYNPIFNIIDQAEVIGHNFDYKSNDKQLPENWEKVDQEIGRVEAVIKTLRHDLENYVDSFKKQFHSQKELTLNGLKEVRENLIFIKYHVKPEGSGLFGLAKKKTTTTAPLQSKLDNILESFNQDVQSRNILGSHLTAELTAESLSQAIQRLESISITHEQIEVIKQKLNLNHLEGIKKSKLTKLIETTINNLNQSEILYDKIENGGFTFQHQLQSFEAILQNLFNLKNLRLQLTPYLDWKHFQQNQTRELKHVLHALKRYPHKDWIVLFEAWYINKLIQKHKPHTDTLNYYFEYTANFEKRILEEKLAYIQNLYAAKRESTKQALKKVNKKIYNTITSKKQQAYNWVNLLSSTDFVSNFYPIVISDNIESLAQNRFVDQLILFDNFEYLQSPDLINIASKILVINDKDNKQLSAYLKEKSPFETTLSTPYQLALQALEIKPSNRFQVIKTLAKNIFAINSNYQYYQTKNLSIISFCDAQKNSAMMDYFQSRHIKALPKTNSDLGIVEVLLDPQKKTVVIFEDSLLNTAKPELYLWQFHLIQCLQSMGTHCFSVSSEAHYRKGKSYLKNLWSEIDGINPQVPQKKQELLNAQSN